MPSLFTKKVVAADCGMSVMKMHKELRERGIFDKENLPRKAYKHYFKVTNGSFMHPVTGRYHPYASVRVTRPGKRFIECVLTDKHKPINIEEYLIATPHTQRQHAK